MGGRDQARLSRSEPDPRHPHVRTYTLAAGQEAWEVTDVEDRLAASALVMLLTRARRDLDTYDYWVAFGAGIDFDWQPSRAFWTSFSILRLPFLRDQVEAQMVWPEAWS
jgi:hypothetical protein